MGRFFEASKATVGIQRDEKIAKIPEKFPKSPEDAKNWIFGLFKRIFRNSQLLGGAKKLQE